MAKQRRSFLFLPLVILTCAVAGGIYGPRVNAAASAGDDDDVKTSMKNFTVFTVWWKTISPILSVRIKSIYNGAIPGMLRTLDPHSNFFDPKAFALMREDQRGNYYGVGMRVGVRMGKTMVFEPFKGSPAFRAGIRPGDYIVAVNDKSTVT